MSQYSLIVPGLYCRGLVRRLCHNTKFCIVTVDWARWVRDWACWARKQAQAGAGARRWACRARRWLGERALGGTAQARGACGLGAGRAASADLGVLSWARLGFCAL